MRLATIFLVLSIKLFEFKSRVEFNLAKDEGRYKCHSEVAFILIRCVSVAVF